MYAMKKVLIQNSEQLETVKEEIRVSSLFSHSNLLPLLDHAIVSVKFLEFRLLAGMAPKSVTKTVPHDRRLLHYAVASRIFLLTLTSLWRSLLSPYDTSASINPPCLSTNSSAPNHHAPPPVLLPRVGSAIGNSIVWDGVYFVRIAECGYEYEQSYAFLPLLPVCISVLAKTVFAPLVPVIGYRAVLGLSGYVLNNVAFVFAAFYLYRLSLVVLKDRDVALRASVLFCFNPASIFYSTVYSESLYAFLSFGGLFHFVNGSDYYASMWLALSGSARSNGVLNAGYICFRTMLRLRKAFFSRKLSFLTLKILVSGALCCLCIFAPFISFQAYGYFNICMGHSAVQMRPWCTERLPLLYNYIQSHYWGVGLLRYFQVKQLPNFLLASPILSLAVCSILYYVKRQPEVFLSLGLRASSLEQEMVVSPLASAEEAGSSAAGFRDNDASNLSQDSSRTVRLRKKEKLVTALPSKSESLDAPQCVSVVILPFVLHLSFMVATAFFVMHVQVATRFLSASPVVYWYASHIMGSRGGVGKIAGRLIWGYCAAYILLGSLLFSNFYPFT